MKYQFNQEISKDNILSFYKEFKDGKTEPFYKSEEIPSEPIDGNVKVIVSKSFKTEIIDYEDDAIIMFHLPWCEYCKEILPIFHEIADEMASTKGLKFGKLDSSLNEIKGVTVPTFPTILYYKKGDKENPVLFTEETRTKEYIEAFIEGQQKEKSQTAL